MSLKFLGFLGLGLCLDPWIFAQLGGQHKPILSAWPNPKAPLRSHVNIQCQFDCQCVVRFKIQKSTVTELQGVLPNGTFILSPVSAAHAGTYRYSVAYGNNYQTAESELLEIIVTGVFTKPSLLVNPHSLVPEGGNVTLQCLSDIAFDTFILHQEGGLQYFQQHGEKLGKQCDHSCFSVAPVTTAQVGTYRCYGSFSHVPSEWSAPSEPLHLVITGRHRKPSLSTQVGPEMKSGENLTFLCHSESSYHVFHLFLEGKFPGHWFTGVQNGKSQATFDLGPMSPTFSGTYRCYGCFNHSPYEWSHPSDPQNIYFTGPLTTTLSNLETTMRTGPVLDYTVENFIRMTTAGILFLILLVILIEAWLSHEDPQLETEER